MGATYHAIYELLLLLRETWVSCIDVPASASRDTLHERPSYHHTGNTSSKKLYHGTITLYTTDHNHLSTPTRSTT